MNHAVNMNTRRSFSSFTILSCGPFSQEIRTEILIPIANRYIHTRNVTQLVKYSLCNEFQYDSCFRQDVTLCNSEKRKATRGIPGLLATDAELTSSFLLVVLQRLPVTRARFFPISKTKFWCTSIKCIHDNSRVHFVSVSRRCSIVVGQGIIAQTVIMTK